MYPEATMLNSTRPAGSGESSVLSTGHSNSGFALVVIALVVGIFVVMTAAALPRLIKQPIRIQRNLHQSEVVMIQVDDQHPDLLAFRANVDQRLFVPVAAGFANHPRPAFAGVLLHESLQLIAVHCAVLAAVKILKLRYTQAMHAAVS